VIEAEEVAEDLEAMTEVIEEEAEEVVQDQEAQDQAHPPVPVGIVETDTTMIEMADVTIDQREDQDQDQTLAESKIIADHPAQTEVKVATAIRKILEEIAEA
jgi:hypothetical protein